MRYIIAGSMREASALAQRLALDEWQYINNVRDLRMAKSVLLGNGYENRHDWDTLYNYMLSKNISMKVDHS